MNICNPLGTSTETQLPVIVKSSISPGSPNVHAQLYKKNPDNNKQHERRQELLKWQKQGRNTSVDNNRSILDVIDEEEQAEESGNLIAETFIEQQHFYRRERFRRKNKIFETQLMLSEWCVSIPPNFDSEWLMKLCPKGQRTLVVASRGRTKAYDKRGNNTATFRSTLPGGNNDDWAIGCAKCRTVLDCIYNDSTKAFYVLDVLAWSNQQTTNCDTVFRFSWLQSKFAEMPLLSAYDKNLNPYPFFLIPFTNCSALCLSEALSIWPAYSNDTPSIDGLLFYHKLTTYTTGETPLVLWLKTFMVPEIFGMYVNIAEQYINCKPENYSGQDNYIEEFKNTVKQKRFYKRFNRKNTNSVMETSESDQSSSMDADIGTENFVKMEDGETNTNNECNMEENGENSCTMES